VKTLIAGAVSIGALLVPAACQAPETAPAPATGRSAEVVEEGSFQWNVTNLDCSKKEFQRLRANGTWCIVTVAVHNIGVAQRDVYPQRQFLVAADGSRYQGSAAASAVLNPPRALMELKADERRTAGIAFDVPKEARILSVELHDTPDDAGAKVTF